MKTLIAWSRGRKAFLSLLAFKRKAFITGSWANLLCTITVSKWFVRMIDKFFKAWNLASNSCCRTTPALLQLWCSKYSLTLIGRFFCMWCILQLFRLKLILIHAAFLLFTVSRFWEKKILTQKSGVFFYDET